VFFHLHTLKKGFDKYPMSNRDLTTQPKSPPPPQSFRRAIDSLLSSFDAISEWQEIVAFLSRLHKTISTHVIDESIDIPKKLIIAKRLAQVCERCRLCYSV
jgi:hypothetical protein